MPRIAHRRRGSKFGRHPVKVSLVRPPLLPLALSTSSLRHALVPATPLLASSIHPLAAGTSLTSGSFLCL